MVIATLITAQTVDAVSERAFRALTRAAGGNSAAHIRALPLSVVEGALAEVNYYRTKAARIKRIADAMDGMLDDEAARSEFLLSLPGVGSKTAHLVCGVYSGTPCIAVDTHLLRISYRLGLVSSPSNARAAERELMTLFPSECWVALNDYGVRIGKYICTARRPRCAHCPLRTRCPQRGVSGGA